MRKLFFLLAALSLFGTSCEKGEGPEPPPDSASRTVLVYIAGDNSLGMGGYHLTNLRGMIQGIQEGQNLLVYLNLRNTVSKLIKITPDDSGSIDINAQEVVKTYADDNAVDPAVMRTVMNDVVTMYPAESYGLVLWSHGMGWLPVGKSPSRGISAFYGERSMRDPNAPMTKYFGEDRGQFMEIDDMVGAFPPNLKYEFILMDACFMANIETYYEMRNSAKYIIGSPAEILANGFPYEIVTPLFFEKTFSPKKVCEAFMTYYRQPSQQVSYGGTSGPSAVVSYVVASELDGLAAVVKSINSSVPEIADRKTVQAYEKADSHVFFDLGDYIEQRVSAADPALYADFTGRLNSALPYYACTDKLYGNIPSSGFFNVSSSVGMSVYIPGDSSFDTAYYDTSWAKAVNP